MLALIYLFLSSLVGDLICRRFYSFVSLPHRFAAAFLAGLLISSWTTYLGAFLFTKTSQPLLWGNLLFFAVAVGVILQLKRQTAKEYLQEAISQADVKVNKWDWILIGIFAVFASWQMFSTFNMSAGKVQIANHQWSDFGSTVSIMQSFALGNNFPTEYPHFTGERMRYHFLYYFQAGNLEYLGLNPALANNLLSILTLVSMLVLIMTLGTILFRSRIVGRIGAVLFFFHGSLSFIPFFISQGSIGNALKTALTMRDFLPSVFDYRGELWGIWSQVVFLNQRHFASSIGIFLLVVIFLVIRYQASFSPDENFEESVNHNADTENISLKNRLPATLKTSAPFIFSGALLGLMPMWNSAVFVAALAVLGLFFLLFPLRKQMIALAVTAALVALPQVIFLKTGNMRAAGYSLFHWGYTIESPTFANVIQYLGFTFGFKLLLIAFALFFATQFQRRFFLAVSGLIALAFCFQFSDEVLANHKFLNIWLAATNIFVAFGLWRLWNSNLLKSALISKIAVVALTTLITIGGIIDLFPIRNGYWMEMPFENDTLVNWMRDQTEPQAIFLSHRFVNHGILLAGRRVFYGHPYYAWSAGYPTAERDVVYKKMFETQNPQEVWQMLRENRISYIAIDNQLRQDGFIKNLNETVFQKYFETVFQDTENKYNNLNIYKVPANLGSIPKQTLSNDEIFDPNIPAVSALTGGQGKGRGQFDKPRGVATDADGNIYVADSGNSRIQKFSPDGEFISVFGKTGTGEGELREPNGIAVDSEGSIYVADALNHRLLKFKPDGGFVKQWLGPEINFYGPRDLAIAPNKQIYILDQGRTRVVKFDPQSEKFTEWGRKGTEAGEFNDPTGLTVGGNLIFVTDAGNNRIQVFDLNGKFIRQWDVPEWDKYLWHYPDAAFDPKTKRLCVTSGWTNEVLVFDVDGNRSDSLKVAESATLDNPSSLALQITGSRSRLYVLNTGSSRISVFGLQNK
jgi:DNA-binding beta-propeller fold protein YncE